MVRSFFRSVQAARSAFASFCSDRRGNVAVIAAAATLPLVVGAGCVVDYTTAAMVRSKLQAAADTASLATVSLKSSVITTAKTMNTDGAVSGGDTFALGFFNANLATAPENTGYTGLSPTAAVTKSGMIVTATVNFTAQVPTYFVGVLGANYHNIAVSGSSTASYTLPTYIDFYLMLDVSGSMSFPSTTAEQTRLQSVNPDDRNGPYPGGCTFACHFTRQGACAQSTQGSIPAPGSTTNPGTGGYCQGFIVSRLGTTPASGTLSASNVNWTNTQVSSCSSPGTTSCIQLRADAVGYAVNALLTTAAGSEKVTNQYRVGLYPFIQKLYSYFALTTNLTATGSGTINNAASNLASLLDTGQNTNLGSGGTHFENALSSMNTLISTVGAAPARATPSRTSSS